MNTLKDGFTKWFREIAPYIRMHSGKTIVLHLCGQSFFNSDTLRELIWDISLVNSLGLRVVMLFDVEPQLIECLGTVQSDGQYSGSKRVTDKATLACLKGLIGEMLLQLMALFSSGLPNMPMSAVTVATGNFITAKPVGVIDGVDFQYTGLLRRVYTADITDRLQHNEIVIIPPVGYSFTGEVFSLNSLDLAVSCAKELSVDKLLFFSSKKIVDKSIASCTTSQAQHMLKPGDSNALLRAGITACEAGVPRVHYIDLQGGYLLQELYSCEGVGFLLSAEPFAKIRPADTSDISSLLLLLQPLEEGAILLPRSREKLETQIEDYLVCVRDETIIACAALHVHVDKIAELAAFVVAPDYRRQGVGKGLLSAIIERARMIGCERLWAFTTHTDHWFLQQGFSIEKGKQLPDDICSSHSIRNAKSLIYQIKP